MPGRGRLHVACLGHLRGRAPNGLGKHGVAQSGWRLLAGTRGRGMPRPYNGIVGAGMPGPGRHHIACLGHLRGRARNGLGKHAVAQSGWRLLGGTRGRGMPRPYNGIVRAGHARPGFREALGHRQPYLRNGPLSLGSRLRRQMEANVASARCVHAAPRGRRPSGGGITWHMRPKYQLSALLPNASKQQHDGARLSKYQRMSECSFGSTTVNERARCFSSNS